MSKNDLSSSGIGEDLLRSIQQFGAAEMHLKTLYEKTLAEMENGMIDVNDSVKLSKHLEKLDTYQADIDSVTQLRRQAMRILLSLFEDTDKDVWCLVKHLGIASMCVFEAYQASENDPELLDLWIDSNKSFVKSVTRFLGAEISDCAACLSDYLKGKDSISNTKGE